VFQPTVRQPRIVDQPSLDELLANVMRNTGWIMAGGSAQFRQGALSELQTNLGLLHLHALGQRGALAAKVLGEKAVLVASRNVNDVESIMSLHRVLGEFELAAKACLSKR
jgi:hypothetical protein